MIPILQPPVRRWYCPNCKATAETRQINQVPGHLCPRLRGLAVPFLPVGVAAKIEARDREDYVGDELVQVDAEGRPVMSIVTTRDEGQDCIVLAPTATLRA
jgi:Zn-finger nucleic acid-binding protein